jgi:xylulose-5-phosphate/fructose-6-phosphate phosphoketolase
MVMLNGVSRYHLAAEALRRAPEIRNGAPDLIDEYESLIAQAVDYARQVEVEDASHIRDCVWTES